MCGLYTSSISILYVGCPCRYYSYFLFEITSFVTSGYLISVQKFVNLIDWQVNFSKLRCVILLLRERTRRVTINKIHMII